jgi:succinate dehydrogenase assembly factor 1
MVHSGIQQQVLSLYRHILRAAAHHPEPTRSSVRSYAREEFERFRAVSKLDVQRIEHLLRKGSKQLEWLMSPSFQGFSRH